MNQYIPCVVGDKNQYRKYIRHILANSCMPTLTLTKPSSLIGFQKKECISDEIFLECLQKELLHFPVEFHILFENKKSYFVFIYHAGLLSRCLHENCDHPLVKELGYTGEPQKIKKDIHILKQRYQNYLLGNESFPHELGIFLGYPISDVEQYILNGGENYLACGYWKVYSNLEGALTTFRLFKKLKEEGLRLIMNDRNLWEIKNSYIAAGSYGGNR